MKKILIVLVGLMFVAGCAVIDEQFTGPRIRIGPQESYGYVPMYSNYYDPFMWTGWYGWWSPYWLYGYYSPYGSYNPYFWGWYYSPTRIRQGERIIISKDGLRKISSRSVSGNTSSKSSGRTVRSIGSRRVVSRSGAGRTSSTRSGSSSRGSSGRRVIKK